MLGTPEGGDQRRALLYYRPRLSETCRGSAAVMDKKAAPRGLKRGEPWALKNDYVIVR